MRVSQQRLAGFVNSFVLGWQVVLETSRSAIEKHSRVGEGGNNEAYPVRARRKILHVVTVIIVFVPPAVSHGCWRQAVR